MEGTKYIVAPKQIHCEVNFSKVGMSIHNGADEAIGRVPQT